MIESICRVCLAVASNVKMYNIANSTLQEIFEKVTSTKLITSDGRPISICYVCCSQLRRCYKFSKMSQRAETIFSGLMSNGFSEITERTITMLSLGIPHNLSVESTETMVFNSIKDAKIEVKIETSFNYNDTTDPYDIESKELLELFDYKQIKQKISLKEHKMKNNKKICCGACKKKFRTQSHFDEHIHTYHPNEKPDMLVDGANNPKHSCKVCGKTFSQSGHMTVHMRTHTGERPYTCSICSRTFYTKSSLQRHHRQHTGEKPFCCIICNKRFCQVNNLTKHMSTHPDSKNYACKVCKKTFYLHRNMVMHMRLHSEKIKAGMTCNYCNKVFTMHSQFVVHMRTHTGEKPFVCEHCDQRFAQSSHLNVHLRKHTGAKPYSCGTCNKSFSQSSGLQTHEKTHNGLRDQKCHMCKKAYSARTTLNAHLKKVHGYDVRLTKLGRQNELIVKSQE